MRIAGVDGCKTGWVVAERARSGTAPSLRVVTRIEELFDASGSLIAAIDIPIGLSDDRPRSCDQLARNEIGPRRSSVFPAPARAVLVAKSYEDACLRSMTACGKKLSKQSWAIVPKIAEVDELLQRRPELRDRLFEVHPELTFMAWNEEPMTHAKKTLLGSVHRLGLIEEYFGHGTFERFRGLVPRKSAADDDIVDALAALWTADRIAENAFRSLPGTPEIDATGLQMRIVY